MRRPPADHDRALAALLKHVPDGLRASRDVGDRADALAVRSGFGKAVDAVLEGPLAGRDRGPEHRTQRRVQGRVVPVNTVFHEPLEVRHLVFGDQWLDDAPVGGIPADDQDFPVVCSRAHGPTSILRKKPPSYMQQEGSLARLKPVAGVDPRGHDGVQLTQRGMSVIRHRKPHIIAART